MRSDPEAPQGEVRFCKHCGATPLDAAGFFVPQPQGDVREIARQFVLEVVEECARAEGFESFRVSDWSPNLKPLIDRLTAMLSRQQPSEPQPRAHLVTTPNGALVTCWCGDIHTQPIGWTAPSVPAADVRAEDDPRGESPILTFMRQRCELAEQRYAELEAVLQRIIDSHTASETHGFLNADRVLVSGPALRAARTLLSIHAAGQNTPVCAICRKPIHGPGHVPLQSDTQPNAAAQQPDPLA